MKMKKLLRTLVLSIAVIGTMTPSQYGLYNPKCPVKLNFSDIQKKMYNKFSK